MKIKLKPDNTKIKFSKVHPNITRYYKDINKVFAKYTNMNKPNRENTVDNLDCIPADGHDISNYVARYGMANFQIQAIMKLDGRLDFERLQKAVLVSVDAEPVFGCRFSKSDPPYWKRLDDIGNVKFCSIEETDNPDEAVQRFLNSPLDMDNGPVVKVKLIRSGPYDTLGVKVNHVCCDGAGAKEYIHLLSEIYSHIDRKAGGYVPKPSIRSKKDHDRLFSALGIKDPEAAWDPMQKTSIPLWKFPWKNGRRGVTRFAVCRLSSGQLDQLKIFAKERGATINDLILTASYRAMFKISKPPYGIPMDIPITIDLRRYLPDRKTEAIRNLSGGVITSIARKVHEPFEGTLSRVMSVTKKIKTGRPGVQNAIWAERIEKMSFRRTSAYFKSIGNFVEITSRNPFYVVDKCAPVLSNFGFVSKSLIRFGENVVTDAYIIPPVVRAPGILLVASTYNGIITLAAGYYKPSIRRTDIERLLNKIKDELTEGCR